VTTSMNYENRLKNIEMKELSQTFQDVISLSRKLEIRYVWVDALCIIQDSEEDWKRQSGNMMLIYELAWLNVSAAGSEIEPRCFLKRNSRLNRRCKLPAAMAPVLALFAGSDSGEDSIYAHLGSQFYGQAVHDGFLSQRGWIVQERILSPRTLYYGQEEVYWECNTTAASESVPWGWDDDDDDDVWALVKIRSKNGPPSALLQHAPESLNQILYLNQTYVYWYWLVETYSTRHLTRPSDKLPAIQGLAQGLYRSFLAGYQRESNAAFLYAYANGLWLSDICNGLQWHVNATADDTHMAMWSESQVPSYSWASCSLPIKFVLFSQAEHTEQKTSARKRLIVKDNHTLPKLFRSARSLQLPSPK